MGYIDLLTFTFTGDCSGGNNGAIYFEVTGNSPNWVVTEGPPYTGLLPGALLTPLSNSYSATGLSAGTYSFIITETSVPPLNPTEEIRVFQISSGTSVSVLSSGTTCNIDNGSITASTLVNLGVSTFELYDISNNYVTSGETSFGEDFVIFNNLSANTYYVVANDGGGCTGMSESCIVYPSSIFTYGYYVVNDGSCVQQGGGGKIFLTGLTIPTSAYTIDWITDVNGQTGTTITGLTGGLYEVQVTDTNGCTVTEFIPIDTVLPLGIGAVFLTQPSCFSTDGEISVVVTGGTAPFYYTCSNGDTAVSFDSTYTFTGLPSAVYTLTVTDGGLCTTNTQVTLVTPGSFGNVSIIPANSNCSSNNGVITILIDDGIVPGSYTYTLSGDTGEPSVTLQGSQIQTFNDLQTGNYNIFIDNGTGCVFTGNTTIVNTDKFTITGTPISTVCGLNNGILNVNVSTGATFPVTYNLFGPTSNPQNLSQPTGTFINLQAGTYTLTVIDSTQCQQSIPVFIGSSNPVYFDLIGYDPVFGNDGQINVVITSGEPTFTFNWSANVGAQTGTLITGLTSGDYTLQLIDFNGCSLSKTIKLGGTQLLGNYVFTPICEQTFENTQEMGIRSVQQMFNEGFYDLTTGDTNCILNEATFKLVVDVDGVTLENEFYISNSLNDFPDLILWSETLQTMLESYTGVGEVVIDYENNTIKITNDCEEIFKNCQTQTYNLLADTRFIVNMVISYDISCVSCT